MNARIEQLMAVQTNSSVAQILEYLFLSGYKVAGGHAGRIVAVREREGATVKPLYLVRPKKIQILRKCPCNRPQAQ